MLIGDHLDAQGVFTAICYDKDGNVKWEDTFDNVVTTVGKPGVQVASVTKRPGGYVLSHVEGARRPSVNGQAVGEDSVSLKHGDIIDLAGTQMQFVQN